MSSPPQANDAASGVKRAAKRARRAARPKKRFISLSDDEARSTDGDDDGEDLKDFIVEDSEESDSSDDDDDASYTSKSSIKKRAKSQAEGEVASAAVDGNIEDEDSGSGSDASSVSPNDDSHQTLDDETTEEGVRRVVAELSVETDALLTREPMKGSETIGGRTLRARTTIKPAKDEYWERFGRKEQQRLLEIEEKKEKLAEIKAWIKDGLWTAKKSLSVRSSAADVNEEYEQARAAMGLDTRESDSEAEEDTSDEGAADAEDSYNGAEEEDEDEEEEEDEDEEEEEDEDNDDDDE
jgi:hypothetical protein